MTALIDGASFAPAVIAKTPTCGVLAVANFAGVTFEEAWAAIIKYKRAPGRWRGATFDHERHKALRDLGVDYVVTKAYEGLTVQRFVRDYAVQHVRYKVHVRRHVLTVYNGVVTDQTESVPYDVHWCRRHIIGEIWERVE